MVASGEFVSVGMGMNFLLDDLECGNVLLTKIHNGWWKVR
jgi:hypothetical protein